MAVVDVAIAAGTALGVGGGGVAAGLVGGAAIGAGAGALYSGVTGDGNILNSALTGAMIGGGVGGGGAALGLTGATGTSLGLSGAGALSGVGSALGLAGSASTPALAAAATPGIASAAAPAVTSGASAFGGVGGASIPVTGDAAIGALSAPSTIAPAVVPELSTAAINPATGLSWEATGSGLTGDGAAVTAKDLLAAESAGSGLTGKEMLGYGLAGTAALSLLGGMNQKKLTAGTIPGQNPSMIRPSTYNVTQNASAYPTGPQYGSNGLPILPTKEQNYFNQSYTAGTPYKAAGGGLMSAPPTPGLMDSGSNGDVDFMGGDMYPTSQQNRSYYATPTQMPTSAQEVGASYEPKTNPLTGELMKNMAVGGVAYDPASQKYSQQLPSGVNSYQSSLEPMGFGLGATQFAQPGQIGGFSGDPFGFGGGENLSFTPATSLDPQSLAAMTAQWQSQNPNKRTYDPATQRYGYASPDQGTLLAMKNAQDLAAYQAQQSQQPAYDGSSGGGGAANGGLMSGYAMGGQTYNLGGYSDGGRLLKGPGDGVSDDIPAVIGEKQPARLADGEFVVPARIVSELGNGSTDAGAKRLYAMMDRVQAGRKKTIGKDKVAVNTKADKHLPA